MTNARHVLEVRDAGNIFKSLAVCDGHLVSCIDGLINMFEVDKTHGRTNLVHLPVDARSNDCDLTGKAEVLEVVYALLGLRIVCHQSAALYRVVHLRRVEAERGHVARVKDALAVHLHAKGVGRVIDNLQAVLVGYVLYSLRITRLAIAMNRHDGRGPRSYRSLDAVRVDAAVRRVDVHEHRLDAVPPKRVGCRNEAERRGYDLARDAQGLEGCNQRQGSVGKKADVWNF